MLCMFPKDSRREEYARGLAFVTTKKKERKRANYKAVEDTRMRPQKEVAVTIKGARRQEGK